MIASVNRYNWCTFKTLGIYTGSSEPGQKMTGDDKQASISLNVSKRVKALIDFLVALLLLVLLLPVFVLLAALIYIDDRGPVFFRQARVGLYAKTFQIFKFRTMIVDADKHLTEAGTPSKPRVTRVGKWLRFLSLDELPQLLNIILGDMSFVGPRPGLPEHYARYTEDQKRRVEMKPGVTGLAQVNGRNTLKWSKRIEYDVEYIDSYTLLLDLKILCKTVLVVLLRQGVVLDRNADQVDDLRKDT